MKKLTMAFVLAVVMMSLAFTGAFASGPHEGAGKPDMTLEDGGKVSAGPEQKAERPRNAPPRDETRREKDKAIREFQKAVRNAERKFKESEKAASKLQGEERKEAVYKAAEAMKAEIKKAEKDKDVAMKAFEPRSNQPGREKGNPANEIEARKNRMEKERARRAEEQLKREEKRQKEKQQN